MTAFAMRHSRLGNNPGRMGSKAVHKAEADPGVRGARGSSNRALLGASARCSSPMPPPMCKGCPDTRCKRCLDTEYTRDAPASRETSLPRRPARPWMSADVTPVARLCAMAVPAMPEPQAGVPVPPALHRALAVVTPLAGKATKRIQSLVCKPITVVIYSHANGSFQSHRARANFGSGHSAPALGCGSGLRARVARRGAKDCGAALGTVHLGRCPFRALSRPAPEGPNARRA